MRFRTYIWPSSILLVGAVLGAALPTEPGLSAVDPRPVVMVRVAVESKSYRQYLGDRFDVVERWLADTCRVLLQGRFGFVNWASGKSPALDTVVVHWFDKPAVPRDVRFKLELRGKSGRAMPFEDQFESFGQVSDRSEWTPAVVQSRWGHVLDSIIGGSASSLVAGVLGTLPLAVRVDLDPKNLKAHIHLLPKSIQAATRPKPKFLLKVTLTDPGPPVATTDEAEFRLGGCLPAPPSGTYFCDLEWLVYQDTTVLARDHRALIGRSKMRQRSLHMLAYTAAPEDPPLAASEDQ
jgi:hypothetical protein